MSMTNVLEIDEFKKYLQYPNYSAITELNMIVEMPVNITKSLYDDMPVY